MDNSPEEPKRQNSQKLPPRVYIIRRIVAFLILVALIIVVVFVVRAVGNLISGDGNKDKTQSSASSEEQKSENDPADSKDSENKNPKGEKPELPVCAPESLMVTAFTDNKTYGADKKPQLFFKVENIGKENCTSALGTKDMIFEISSGNEIYWRSTDCQEEGKELPIILKPGEVLESEGLEWDRTRSNPDTCTVEKEQVPAGGASYHLRVSVAGVKSEQSAQFILQ